MPVNDWFERKCKQDSKIILERHQADSLWNGVGKGKKQEHVCNVDPPAPTDCSLLAHSIQRIGLKDWCVTLTQKLKGAWK